MAIVVTGGAGFIGSALVMDLIQTTKEKVFVFDSLTYAGNRKNLPANDKNFEFLQIDITNERALRDGWKLVQDCGSQSNYVFHLAAESHVDRSIHSGAVFSSTNVLGTQLMLESSSRNNVEKFLHVSTDEVYGSIATDEADEHYPLNPSSAYSASKASSDLFVLAHAKTHGLNVVITRCVNNHGPKQLMEKFIPRMTYRANLGMELPVYGSGKNLREWISVSDHVDALIRVMEKGRSGEIYNIGTGERASNIEIANFILERVVTDSRISFIDDRLGHDFRYAISSKKIHDELCWKPRMKLMDGLAITIDEISKEAKIEQNISRFMEIEKNYAN
jgi:dTDP-glucose 4,6-dehydratase